MVDAGSAGCMTLPGLRKFIVDKSQTRILALLNIACHGMAGAGCSGADFGPGGKESFSMQCFTFQLYSYERFVLSKCVQVIGKTLLDKNSLPGGENDHLNAIKLKPCIDAIEANRDLIVGVKVCSYKFSKKYLNSYL